VAVAPVLLDGYQLQMEQTIMPDVWFEAMIVGGLAVLLWRPAVTVRLAALAGLVFGLSATLHQVGEVLIVPAVFYLLVVAGSVRRAATTTAALAVAFALPIVLYCSVSYASNGHFRLAVGQTTVGRVVGAADCATLRLPAAVRPLCPTPSEQAKGPDWLEHSKYSPPAPGAIPAGENRAKLISQLTSAIKSQQPLRILGGIARDSVRLFAVTREPSPWVTPLSRWQFQSHYPTYPHWITLGPGNVIVVGIQRVAYGQFHFSKLKPGYGGKAQVDRPVAAFLRSYQRNGGFTPGPFLLLCMAAGVIGTLLAVVLRVRQARRPQSAAGAARAGQLALACLLFTATVVVLLLAQDIVEFSWRYQLPAVITLPPAGILGLSALLALRRGAAAPAAAAPLPASGGPVAPAVNGSAAQAGESPDQAAGEPGPAGA
jgi:hypothetical protein